MRVATLVSAAFFSLALAAMPARCEETRANDRGFNVMSYGAVCNDRGDGTADGVRPSTDDSAHVLAAEAAAEAAGGGVIEFPFNRGCRVSSQITLRGWGIELRGGHRTASYRVGAPIRDKTVKPGSILVLSGTGGGTCAPGQNGLIRVTGSEMKIKGLSMRAINPAAGCVINATATASGPQGLELYDDEIAGTSATTSLIGVYGNIELSHIHRVTFNSYSQAIVLLQPRGANAPTLNQIDNIYLGGSLAPWLYQMDISGIQGYSITLGPNINTEFGPNNIWLHDGIRGTLIVGNGFSDARPTGKNGCTRFSTDIKWQPNLLEPFSCAWPSTGYLGNGPMNHTIFVVTEVTGEGKCLSEPRWADAAKPGQTVACDGFGGKVTFQNWNTGAAIYNQGFETYVTGNAISAVAAGVLMHGQAGGVVGNDLYGYVSYLDNWGQSGGVEGGNRFYSGYRNIAPYDYIDTELSSTGIMLEGNYFFHRDEANCMKSFKGSSGGDYENHQFGCINDFSGAGPYWNSFESGFANVQNLQLRGGSPIRNHKSITFKADIGVIADGRCADTPAQTIGGAAAGDTVSVADSVGAPAGFMLGGFVSAANTVKARWCNFSGVSSDPDGGMQRTYRVDWWGH